MAEHPPPQIPRWVTYMQYIFDNRKKEFLTNAIMFCFCDMIVPGAWAGLFRMATAVSKRPLSVPTVPKDTRTDFSLAAVAVWRSNSASVTATRKELHCYIRYKSCLHLRAEFYADVGVLLQSLTPERRHAIMTMSAEDPDELLISYIVFNKVSK